MSQDQDDTARARAARDQISRFHAELHEKDYFQLLGADEDLDTERLKATYHQLAKRWHADTFAGLELGAERRKLDEIFATIQEAYTTLDDPAKRAEYAVYRERRKKGLSTDVTAILDGERVVDDALAAMRKKDWPGARRLLEDALRLNAEDMLYHVYLGWALYRESPALNAARAMQRLQEAARQQENLPLAYQYLGQIAFDRGQPDEARRWWKKCLDWEPKNVVAARGLRLIDTRQGKQETGLVARLKKLFGG